MRDSSDIRDSGDIGAETGETLETVETTDRRNIRDKGDIAVYMKQVPLIITISELIQLLLKALMTLKH